ELTTLIARRHLADIVAGREGAALMQRVLPSYLPNQRWFAAVVLRKVSEVLPTGELQKCAFILPPALREKEKYDLIVLDQQAASYGMRRLVASFFLKDFLKCEVGFERKDITGTFIYQSQAWVTRKKDIWPVEDIARFNERTVEAVQARIVDVGAFAQEVIQDPDEQAEYLVHMKREGLRELTFEPDPEVRRRWTKYAWFKGDEDLQLRIRSEAVGEGKTLHWELDEATNTYLVIIRTVNWEPFLKKGR
ncbi:MAG: nucleoid-associated protein, partial [Chloroflexota bacterium]|nr:nucleoid-associated protein [Chloroflexota bacterium]